MNKENKYDIPKSLKQHYFMDYNILDLVDLFKDIFLQEQKRLQDKMERNPLRKDLQFSPTIFSISKIIAYKYFNDEISFANKAFVKTFKRFPFYEIIRRVEEGGDL